MGLEFDFIDGQTPLEDEEKEGIRIPAISTRAELNEFEQQNIQKAMLWYKRQSISPQDIVAESFICKVHKKMFDEVWRWAGDFRRTNKNIGIDRFQITTELRKLVDDVKYWIDHQVYDPEEIAIRFKHRLVTIHCFSNGNGRHSRLMADILVEKGFDLLPFTWGSHLMDKQRDNYLLAVKAADNNNFLPLINFARS